MHHGRTDSNPPEIAGPDDVDWSRLTWLWILASTALRLAFLLVAPLGLSADEAYYWDWSRELDWGYFSKPPLIAWILAASTAVCGDTSFGVRLPAVLCHAIALLALGGTARTLFDPRTAFRAVLLASLLPGVLGLAFVMTIDAPLVAIWCIALFLLARSLEGPRPLLGLGLALSVGVGMLAKQMMMFFPLLGMLACFATPRGRAALRTPWVWPPLALSYAFTVPTLLWNSRHEWITLRHTSSHFELGRDEPFWITLPEFVGAVVLLLSPILALLFGGVAYRCARGWRELDPNLRFVWIFSALPLLLITTLSLRQSLNANWPAAFFPATAILLAAAWSSSGGHGPDFAFVRRFVRPGIALAGAILVAGYLGVLLWCWISPRPNHRDPIGRLRGWDGFARQIEDRLATEVPGAGSFVLALRRDLVAQLRFHGLGRDRVEYWPTPHGHNNQYDLWNSGRSKVGRDALILMRAGRKDPEFFFEGRFEKLEYLGRIQPGAGKLGELDLYRGRGLRSWPDPGWGGDRAIEGDTEP